MKESILYEHIMVPFLGKNSFQIKSFGCFCILPSSKPYRARVLSVITVLRNDFDKKSFLYNAAAFSSLELIGSHSE